jgi:transcriptional regulator with XRE-family HTH domain
MATNTSQPSRFSAWLRNAMREERWNRAETAEQLGVDPSTVSRWLKGERIPSPELCDRIADVFAVDLDYILNLAGHRPAIFEIDPQSPEGRLLPLIRQVDWNSRPTRLA